MPDLVLLALCLAVGSGVVVATTPYPEGRGTMAGHALRATALVLAIFSAIAALNRSGLLYGNAFARLLADCFEAVGRALGR